MFKVEIQTLRRPDHAKTSLCDALLPFVFGCQSASSRRASFPVRPGTRVPEAFETVPGGADRNRTDDIQLAKLALYQLSYSPIKPGGIVGTGGPRWI
jgi:hypothetical protein